MSLNNLIDLNTIKNYMIIVLIIVTNYFNIRHPILPFSSPFVVMKIVNYYVQISFSKKN